MIRIGILGYGNLGKGVEKAVNAASDQELVGVFTRRDPATLKIATEGVKVYSTDDLSNMTDAIDVLIICGGSATDLPVQTPTYAKEFNVVDSFDTHAKIPQHYEKVGSAASSGNKIAVISAGWDPGLFSLGRCYFSSILPEGADYTFWGRGVSQGHSDAIRRIEGVLDARQYTIPVPDALEAVRSGSRPTLTTRQKHTRECFVVAEEGADKDRIEEEIKSMPNYFADYDTTVHFITKEELDRDHSGLPHGGSVIYTGKTSDNASHTLELNLKLDSNPEFTGSVLCACARAAYRMNKEGQKGARTMFDIPPAYLSPLEADELRAKLL